MLWGGKYTEASRILLTLHSTKSTFYFLLYLLTTGYMMYDDGFDITIYTIISINYDTIIKLDSQVV